MTDKTIATLQKHFEFNYPVYSGTLVTCNECQEDYWMSGPEFKANSNDGFRKILLHSGDCETHNKLMAEFKQNDADSYEQDVLSIEDIVRRVNSNMTCSYPFIEYNFKLMPSYLSIIVIDRHHKSASIAPNMRQERFQIKDIMEAYHCETLEEFLMDNYRDITSVLLAHR